MNRPNSIPISISGDASGPRVLCDIPDPANISSRGGHQLLIETSGVTTVDAYTGLAVRASLEQHLAADADATVCPWLPRDAVARRRLFSLLGELPQRCELPGDMARPTDDPRIIVPVTSIEDDPRVGMVASGLLSAANSPARGRLRLPRQEAYLLGDAAAIFLTNALDHGSGSSCAPFLACAMEAGERRTTVAVLDLGIDVSHSPDPPARLREALARSREEDGEIASLIAEARHRLLDVSMMIRTGTAIARWSGSWRTEKAAFSPGWAIGLSVQPAPRR
jgi:hypothetical protein